MISHAILVHGGVGSSTRLTGACKAVCRQAFAMLEAGGRALDAACVAVRLLEDDGRFNAGSGSLLRLDGRTVEMDASVMDSAGHLGAVMALRDARNPVLVARAVTETPHVALAGLGADLFARQMGFEGRAPLSEEVRRRYRTMLSLIKEGKLQKRDVRWKATDVRRLWNFPMPYEEVFSTDTVGAVAIDRRGQFAAANSTGGASPMMLGRVGDTAIVGAGFYVGGKAALAATGIGEEILRRMLAKTVYDLIQEGHTISSACEQGIAAFPRAVPVGIIAISRAGYAITANRRMAACALIKEASLGLTSPPSASPSCE
jgi:L-asparaginase/beta-aspartyl-peptidase (threonine type)